MSPSGPFQRERWTSPLRGPWLASVLSVGLAVLFGVELVTGYLSHAAYQPQLGANDLTGGGLDQQLFGWAWPTSPAWLYLANQGLHVVAGVALIPIVAAKLWAVMPKFYKWPPVRSPADALERLSLGLLVGSTLFLLFSGVWNIAYWYSAFRGFDFVAAHYYAAWVFLGSLLAHVIIKFPVMVRAFREHGLRPLGQSLADTIPEPADPQTSAPLAPATPALSRRGLLGLVGATSAGFALLLAGQSIGGVTRGISLFAPRRQDPGGGPNGFQVNKTAASAGIKPEETQSAWRLTLRGTRARELSRTELLALPQHTYQLPIACVEGWSTTQTWTGVRLRDLADLAGSGDAGQVLVESLQSDGVLRQATLNRGQLHDERSLLALRVNGVDLSLDHGFPARVIVPALPGVHNTKWVAKMTFEAA